MKLEQQRIAIAEACGWTGIQQGNNCQGKRLLGVSPANKGRTNYDGAVLSEVPDYLNDLNAMHEAEKALKSNELFSYLIELNKLCPDEPCLLWATARQRAEAFLRTFNLWVED